MGGPRGWRLASIGDWIEIYDEEDEFRFRFAKHLLPDFPNGADPTAWLHVLRQAFESGFAQGVATGEYRKTQEVKYLIRETQAALDL